MRVTLSIELLACKDTFDMEVAERQLSHALSLPTASPLTLRSNIFSLQEKIAEDESKQYGQENGQCAWNDERMIKNVFPDSG